MNHYRNRKKCFGFQLLTVSSVSKHLTQGSGLINNVTNIALDKLSQLMLMLLKVALHYIWSAVSLYPHMDD